MTWWNVVARGPTRCTLDMPDKRTAQTLNRQQNPLYAGGREAEMPPLGAAFLYSVEATGFDPVTVRLTSGSSTRLNYAPYRPDSHEGPELLSPLRVSVHGTKRLISWGNVCG